MGALTQMQSEDGGQTCYCIGRDEHVTWKCTVLPSSELMIIELTCLREIFVPPLNAKQVSSSILPLLIHLPPLPWCLEHLSQFET